jgi:large subunit ribosomal protein L24|uniref:Large ribosomal subunit protein uL24c n=1 Tax=Thorea hispida TaxID=202687 RepID=A0A1C9CAU0_9FLOR|nr:ribosomal protein L24 [Thorea hispida]AOM65474.1 ribosomal protein L24 [Thorea hispida]ARX95843.1 50S ribosomal protein L24 [Thorea hispida]UNJ79128.1 ribosomal protein L24 [Thorea hispida]
MAKKLKMHVKKGDQVKIISGKYKGKIGSITRVNTKTGKILIKNMNFKTKHCKPKQNGETGKIVQIESPIHSSNVMLYEEKLKIQK